MTFENLHSDINFLCINDLEENTISVFCKKIKQNELNISDFKSYWEKGKRPRKNKQNDICNFKGISCNKLANDLSNESAIVKHYFNLRLFKKKYNGNYLCKFKTKKEAGVFFDNSKLSNPSHHNFFKSDNFSLEKIEVIEIVKISNNYA